MATYSFRNQGRWAGLDAPLGDLAPSKWTTGDFHIVTGDRVIFKTDEHCIQTWS